MSTNEPGTEPKPDLPIHKALKVAIEAGTTEAGTTPDQIETIERLLTFGANPSIQGSDGFSAIELAGGLPDQYKNKIITRMKSIARNDR